MLIYSNKNWNLTKKWGEKPEMLLDESVFAILENVQSVKIRFSGFDKTQVHWTSFVPSKIRWGKRMQSFLTHLCLRSCEVQVAFLFVFVHGRTYVRIYTHLYAWMTNERKVDAIFMTMCIGSWIMGEASGRLNVSQMKGW